MSPLFGRRGKHRRSDDNQPRFGPREASEELTRIQIQQTRSQRFRDRLDSICVFVVHNNNQGLLIVWEGPNGRFGEWYTEVFPAEVVSALKQIRRRLKPNEMPIGQVGSPVTRDELVSRVEILIVGFTTKKPKVFDTNIEWPSR